MFLFAEVSLAQETIPNKDNAVPEVYTVVEEMPEFPGGTQQMMKFIQINSRYPISVKEKNIGGKVFLNFIVKEDGSLTNIKTIKSSGNKELDQEAIVMMGFMPKWKPGKQNGKEVSVIYNLPVSYGLDTPYFVFNPNNHDENYLAAKNYIEKADIKSALKNLKNIENQNGLDVLYCTSVIKYSQGEINDACLLFAKIDEIFGSDSGLIINNSKKYKEKYCSN